jgi:hypothetical protein
VIAKGIARIHWQNLVNFGVLPLTFVNPSDYELLQPEQTVRITGIGDALRSGSELGAQENNIMHWGLRAASYVVLPVAKLYKSIWEYDPQTLGKDLSAHLVYGLGMATAFQLLDRRRPDRRCDRTGAPGTRQLHGRNVQRMRRYWASEGGIDYGSAGC